ncbi:hypothetical protein AKO1_010336 [Acrasis kona]|uniref:Nudix hydrolase domain-containing protein n=1 Tax=Acrasis kona TaxID=1008807 RepID=A0AAW2Z6G9_9EUKA
MYVSTICLLNEPNLDLMKFLNYELEKTCYFDTKQGAGVILHSPIPSYKQLLLRQNMSQPLGQPKQQINLDDETETALQINQLLKTYTKKYVTCPSCESDNTFSPNNNDTDNTTFAILCKDCNNLSKKNVQDDPFLGIINTSRTRNNNMQQQNIQPYYNPMPPQYALPYPINYYIHPTHVPYYPYTFPYMSYFPQPYYFIPTPIYENEQHFTPSPTLSPPSSTLTTNANEPNEPFYKSAGILPYCKDANTGRIVILLGKETRGSKLNRPLHAEGSSFESPYKVTKIRPTWSEFGGKKIRSDQDAIVTAAREFSEETHGAFSDEPTFNINRSSTLVQDLLRRNEKSVYNKNGKYMLFVLELPQLSKQNMLNAMNVRKQANDAGDVIDKVDFEWIDAEHLFGLICGDGSDAKQMVSQESGLLQWKQGEELHPFFLTLFRSAKGLVADVLKDQIVLAVKDTCATKRRRRGAGMKNS